MNEINREVYYRKILEVWNVHVLFIIVFQKKLEKLLKQIGKELVV